MVPAKNFSEDLDQEEKTKSIPSDTSIKNQSPVMSLSEGENSDESYKQEFKPPTFKKSGNGNKSIVEIILDKNIRQERIRNRKFENNKMTHVIQNGMKLKLIKPQPPT